MNAEETKAIFDARAREYDARPSHMPHLDEIRRDAVRFLQLKTAAPDVLDLGAGTGAFASAFLEFFPDARITLIDISSNMLRVAKERLSEKAVQCITADYTEYAFARQYDVILTSLSVHHLEQHKREGLYKKCYAILKPGGVFLNVDKARPATEKMEPLYHDASMRYMREIGMDTPQIHKTHTNMQHDMPATIQEQLNWLEKAGFAAADCIFKYETLAAIFAQKA